MSAGSERSTIRSCFGRGRFASRAAETRPSGELLRQLLAADTISPTSRAVLILHFEEELSLPEVAAILDIPVGTAKSRLGYGLSSIRKHLKASGGSHG